MKDGGIRGVKHSNRHLTFIRISFYEKVWKKNNCSIYFTGTKLPCELKATLIILSTRFPSNLIEHFSFLYCLVASFFFAGTFPGSISLVYIPLINKS